VLSFSSPNGSSRLFAPALFCFLITAAVGNAGSTTTGLVQGQVLMLSKRRAHLAADVSPGKEKLPYTKSLVVILNKDGGSEVAQAAVDGEGRFQINVAPGEYILDLKGPPKGRVRVTKRRFTVIAMQTVQVDLKVQSAVEPM